MVLPSRDLPGGSSNWGRTVERRLENVAFAQRTSQASFQNGQLSTAGQLAAVGNQIEELFNRTVDVQFGSPMSVTGSAVSEPFPRASQIITFGPIPGDRTALLWFSATVSCSPLQNTPAIVFVHNGSERLLRLTPDTAPSSLMNPVESQNRGQFSGFCRVIAPGSSPMSLTVTLARGQDSVSSTLTLSNIVLTLERS